jgi:hypothetical protein
MKRTYTLLFFILMTFCFSANAQLVINEFDYDQVSTDTAEFIELYNAGSTPIVLVDYVIILINGNNNTPYDTIPLSPTTLNPGSFYVICGSAGFVANCNQMEAAASNILQNGSPDAMGLIQLSTTSLVDAVSYEGSVPGFVEGNGVPPGPGTSDSLEVNTGLSRFPDGMDTGDNASDFHYACISPGTANLNTSTNCATSIPTLTVNNKVVLFPNPAKQKVSLLGVPSSNTDWEITIYDLTGKMSQHLFAKSSNGSITLDISTLVEGVYMLSATNSNFPTYKGMAKLTVNE